MATGHGSGVPNPGMYVDMADMYFYRVKSLRRIVCAQTPMPDLLLRMYSTQLRTMDYGTMPFPLRDARRYTIVPNSGESYLVIALK